MVGGMMGGGMGMFGGNGIGQQNNSNGHMNFQNFNSAPGSGLMLGGLMSGAMNNSSSSSGVGGGVAGGGAPEPVGAAPTE